MRQIQPDLWETETENPAPGLWTHAYLLTRGAGNVLFYNTGNHREIEGLAALGGVAYQFLSHQDELGDSLNVIGARYGSKLGGHRQEQTVFARVRPLDIVFEGRATHLGNIEVIPTPGHSPGSTCFLVASPTGKRYLFTGDTLYRGKGGVWNAGFIPGYTPEEARETLAESLRLLRGLRPDVVLSSGFTGTEGFEELAGTVWEQRVDGALERLLATAA